jgi:hypothetical protein
MAIEAKLPAMVPAPQVSGFTGFLYNKRTAVRAYITDTMKGVLLIACQKQGLIEIIFKQGKRVTAARFRYHSGITYKLPTAGKQLLFGLLKNRLIGIKIGMQCFGQGNVPVYIKTRHAQKLIR